MTISRWRETERAHMISAIHEMIEEARKKAKSKPAPANERIRWTRLAGQLIWYKDSILRSMTQEAMEKELIVLKKKVLEKKPEENLHLATCGLDSHPSNKTTRSSRSSRQFCAEQGETKLQPAPIPILGNRYFGARHFTLVATGIRTLRKTTDKPIMRQSS